MSGHDRVVQMDSVPGLALSIRLSFALKRLRSKYKIDICEKSILGGRRVDRPNRYLMPRHSSASTSSFPQTPPIVHSSELLCDNPQALFCTSSSIWTRLWLSSNNVCSFCSGRTSTACLDVSAQLCPGVGVQTDELNGEVETGDDISDAGDEHLESTVEQDVEAKDQVSGELMDEVENTLGTPAQEAAENAKEDDDSDDDDDEEKYGTFEASL